MASGKGNTYCQELLKLYFFAQRIPNIAENSTSSPLTSTWAALHYADPGAAGTQTSTEVAYAGYVRVAVARNSTTGWSISGQTISPLSNISFPQATSATGATTAAWFSIGVSSSGSGDISYWGPLSPTISINNGVTPIVSSTSTITEA